MHARMNIFLFNATDFKSQAEMHPDKLVVKMQLEICQLLNNQLPQENQFYKPTHTKHPCSVWLSESTINWSYGVRYLQSLISEYEVRYKKVSNYRLRLDHFNKYFENSEVMPKEFAIAVNEKWLNCMLTEKTVSDDEYDQLVKTKKANAELATRVYQRYLVLAKCHYAEWRYTPSPDFFGDVNMLSRHKGRFCKLRGH